MAVVVTHLLSLKLGAKIEKLSRTDFWQIVKLKTHEKPNGT
jgi:hypothetical protein